MRIRPYCPEDLGGVLSLWNMSVDAGEVVYRPLDKAYFTTKFLENPSYNPRYALVAVLDAQVVGYIHGIVKTVFLPGETHQSTPGYVTVLFVSPTHRRTGIGAELLSALLSLFREDGKTSVAVASSNPINLDWCVPGTPGHDHNNAPGVDIDCPGFSFFQRHGFVERHREVAMYLNLSDYHWAESLTEIRARLASDGIYTGPYDASLGYDYNPMCDHVRSEYWRSAISTEIEAWRTGTPCTDLRFLPNGKIPAGPRELIVATHQKKIVGFTGPVDLQESGRGFFTGICTDSEYERRGIATVLFNLLMQAFVEEGATFSTLFTGDTSHAQKLYQRTGFRVVRRFALMRKETL